MEDDHRVWPPHTGARHRRTPPDDTEPARDDTPGASAWGAPTPSRRGRAHPYARATDTSGRVPAQEGRERRSHPLDLDETDSGWPRAERVDDWPDHDATEEDEAWSPRIRGAAPRESGDWESLPPSARLYGAPAAPGLRAVGGRRWRRVAVIVTAVVAGVGLVAGGVAVVPRLLAPQPESVRLSDPRAGLSAPLPQGWTQEAVTPVTGFTSAARSPDGALLLAGPVTEPVQDPKKATAQAAELYSRLLLKGDRVTVVEDRKLPGGHTRALRAEYRDVVNRPAFLRVMLLTRNGRPVLLVGLLQPEENTHRKALDTVLSSVR